MKRQLPILLCLCTLVSLLAVPSCTEQQLRQADRAVVDVNAVGSAVRTGANAPGVPGPIRTAGELIGGLAGLVLLGWREIRASKILEKSTEKSVALQAIVDGVDQAPAAAAAEVKAAIKAVMTNREILSAANPIVDAHRRRLAT